MAYIDNLDEIKSKLGAIGVLELIGYRGSSPIEIGKEIRDYCPLHEGDNQRSLAINTETGAWLCHSCQAKGGDLISLYQQATGRDFLTAISELTEQLQIDVRHSGNGDKPGATPNPQTQGLTAQQAWDAAKPGNGHEYLIKKKVEACQGLRYGGDSIGNHSVVVPFYDVDGAIKTIQYVHSRGKFFLSGHSSKGAFFPIGEISNGIDIYMAEGLATALTIWLALGREAPVVSFGSAGNMLSVLEALRKAYPQSKIIICLDKNEAAFSQAMKVGSLGVEFRVPSFEGLSYPSGEEPNDFNDIVSKCEQSPEAVRLQLETPFDISTWMPKEQAQDWTRKEQTEEKTSTATEGQPPAQDASFHGRLGKIIGDPEFSLQLKGRNYDAFEREHRRLFSSGGLITGYGKIDEQLYFAKGDFVVIQAMSNHGKSTFMLQLAYRFLTEETNQNKDPMCIFVTYESMPIRIEEKLINVISQDCDGHTLIKYDIRTEEKYLYPISCDFLKSKARFNQLMKDDRIHILKSTPLEKLEHMIDLYMAEYPGRTLVLFLDYIQIIDTAIKSDGWERIKAIAYKLESLAIKKEVIIISACQVNENRQAREGRDIYNAATTVLDIFNHSHVSLKNNKDHQKDYKPLVNGKNVCTLSAVKQKHGSSFDLPEYFLFDGYAFDINEGYISKQNGINGMKNKNENISVKSFADDYQ